VLEPLGSGGMGLVCAAYDSELDRKVAIKLLRPQIATSGKIALAQARLLREAQAMARLAHPNVVTIHEVGTHGDQVFIAMEFLFGLTLKRWLRRTRRPWQEVLAVFLQAGRGLAAAHAAGLIHRDFKPDNVMVTEDPRTGKLDRVRVFDFGVVQETREAAIRQSSFGQRTPSPDGRRVTTPDPERRMDRSSSEDLPSEPLRKMLRSSLPLQGEVTPTDSQDSVPSIDSSLHEDEIYATGLTAAGALVGTPLYMAPEQYDGTADARSDQFSFCAALYEALYRRRPFGGDTAARLQQAKLIGAIRRPPRNHEVPAWLHRIVVRGLASNPARRFPTMDALLVELARDNRRRQPRVLIGLGVALCLIGLGAALAWSLARAPGDLCMSAAASLSPVWNPDRRAQAQAAFRGSGRSYAQSTWNTIEPRMDAYAKAWVEQRVGLCRAASDPQQGHALALRHFCLEQRREEFAALVDLLQRADGGVVDNAVQAVAQLQPVVGCDDPAGHFTRAPRPAAGLQSEAGTLEQRLAELRALEQTGKYHTGIELANAVVRDARALGHTPLVAEALYWQGVLHSRVGAPKPAETALREAALLAEESRHDPIVASAATELVRVIGVDQERHAEGLVWSDLAGAALRRVGDERGEVIRRGYIGHLHEIRGELRAAQAAYTDALARAREHFPEEHPAMATALDDLAGTQLEQGEYAAAQASYEKVLQIRQATQGAGHPRVAEALGHLGRVAAEQGRQDQAREMFGQALRICEILRACNPADRAEALINLGRSEHALGRSGEAQRLHEEALALYEGLYGRDHSKIAALLLALGELTQQQGRHDEAAEYYHRALAIQRRLQSEDHPAMVAIHLDLGTLALARGRPDEARTALERALEIHHKHGGSENFELAEILDALGLVARAQGRVPDAIDLHTRARQIYRRTLDDPNPHVARITNHLAEDHLAHDEPGLAETLASASLQAQEQAGVTPGNLAATRFVLARSLVADLRGPDADARRARARTLAETALADERLMPGHAAQVEAIAAWLRAQGRR
jgi:serine/threonine protein kinase/tetratricopeptide (TPR) repeat protein